MAKSPYFKGGPTVPVDDGGTGAETALAGLAGLGHATEDHAGIPGVGVSTIQDLWLPRGACNGIWKPNPVATGPTDFVLPSGGTVDNVFDPQMGGATLTVAPVATAFGHAVRFTDAGGANGVYCNGLNTGLDAVGSEVAKPRLVIKASIDPGGGGQPLENNTKLGIGDSLASIADPTTATPYIAFHHFSTNGAPTNLILKRTTAAGGVKGDVDTGITPVVGVPLYFVFEWASLTSMTVSILDNAGAVLYTVTYTGLSDTPVSNGAFRPFFRANVNLIGGGQVAEFFGAAFSYAA